MKKSAICLCFVLCLFIPEVMAQEIKLVAMNSFQPFIIQISKTQSKGIAVEVVEQLFKEAKIEVDPVKLYPLKRMIKNVQTDPYTFGFSLFRTPARENQYKWVVPVTLPIRSILVKLKSRDDIVVNSLDEAKRYKIGIVNGNNLETTLKKSGFTKLEGVSTNEINYKKLFGGRIDLVAIREPTIMSELKKKGFSTDDIEIAFALDTGREAWLLTNLKTPDDIIKKLQNAYEVLKKEKVIEKMTRKYY